MATERLYYNDCYRVVFDATVVGISDDRQRISLDRSVFYPPSGGQPRDFGTINGLQITDVVEDDGDLVHVLEQPLPAGLVAVTGEIDWRRRYDHMQQHTGQHLLSAVFSEVLGFQTLSFHLGPEVSTIELETPLLSEVDIARVETRANELAWNSLPVSISYEDSGSAAALRKASEREGTLRVIEIDRVDRSACGGTHVRSTSELAPIQVRGSEKVRGNIRAEFVCGGRALGRAKVDFRLLKAAALHLGCPLEAVSEGMNRLRERAAEAEKGIERLGAESARWEAAALYREAGLTPAGLRFVSLQRPVDDGARHLAAAFSELGRAALVLWSEQTGSILFAASPDSGLHAGNLLKPLLVKYGGKGGGSATKAQGSVPSGNTGALVAGELELACQGAAQSASGKQ